MRVPILHVMMIAVARNCKTDIKWWHSPLLKLYDSLIRSDGVRLADLIVVMAGRMERKRYGLELYRAGVAPRLVLSIGRFEVSRMRELDLEKADELIALRDRTEPGRRHFFVKMDPSGIRIETVGLSIWNTYGEVLGLQQYLAREGARSVMVISTDVHLRRVAATFSKVFRDEPIEFLYCAVPGRLGFLRRDGWWTRPDRWFVVMELLKLAGYRVIFSTPAWAIPRLMRLRRFCGTRRIRV
jgi:uncharacterized SAM-binding protein YcdF (DUF218 family)